MLEYWSLFAIPNRIEEGNIPISKVRDWIKDEGLINGRGKERGERQVLDSSISL